MNTNFYTGKKVLITGHTGFKGTWLCSVLIKLGAEVYGYSLEPPTAPSLYEISGIDKQIVSRIGDIADYDSLIHFFDEVKPEIVFHLAAQPIVREGYKNPIYTYRTNVMGTVNVCEAVHRTPSVRSFINVTTDKVYRNRDLQVAFVEEEVLNGFDPYSNSKSCSELVTACYINSFFNDVEYEKLFGEEVKAPAVSTCRAGNVIGGGDFAKDRILPDAFRSIQNNKKLVVRNPDSIRPYQHVLEPIYVYLKIAELQYDNRDYAGNYNVGPDDENCLLTGTLITRLADKWNKYNNKTLEWIVCGDGGPHEANYLKLDCTKLKEKINWRPLLTMDETLDLIVEWYETFFTGRDVMELMNKQIEDTLPRTGLIDGVSL